MSGSFRRAFGFRCCLSGIRAYLLRLRSCRRIFRRGGIFGVRLKSNRGAAGTDGGTGLFCFCTGLDPVDSGFSVSLFDFHKGEQAHPVRFVVPVFRLVPVHSGDHGFVFFCFVCAIIMPQVRIIEYIKQIFLQFVVYLIRFLFFPFGYFRKAYF